MRLPGISSLSRAFGLLIFAGVMLAVATVAQAADLTVKVNRQGVGNKGTQPLANAQVCVTSANGTLSGNTNSQGTIVFSNSPQGQLTVVASASGFVGQSIQFTMGTINKTESFVLQAGSGGPTCTVKNPPPPPPPVTVASVTLDHSFVNSPLFAGGTVTLSSAAASGGFVVSLSSSNTSIATVPSTITVPANSLTQTFDVSTLVAPATATVTITASGGGTSKTVSLQVVPQVPASATLRVLVGTTTTVISGASVCVTSSSGASRSRLTDLAGNAVFDGIAPGQVTITVSSSGFTGQSHTSTLPPDGGTARFIMTAGSGGPVCTAAAPPPSPAT